MAKTTLELPDEVMRAVRLRAIDENRRLKDVVADLLTRGLAAPSETPSPRPKRVRLPLVQCARAAPPEEEVTPEQVAEVLLRQEEDASER